MRRLGTFIFGATLFVVAVGCNSILENEPGRLDRGASAGGGSSVPSDDGNGAEPIRGTEPDAGGASVSQDGASGGGDTGATPDSGACSVGQKACGGLCVSAEDPFFGCATASCARCEMANATAACTAGACGIAACVAGFGDCNALPADGCETNLQTVNDCGGCALKCPELKNAQMACVASVCTGTCLPGFGDCNAKPEDGCEKNLLKDKNNCGACGTRCVFGRCEGGACVLN
jgi:hypothetical protein